ncbi:hypothetical protein D7X48_15235 [bacterium D16-50]|nr:hypothetical protein D7X48_15235 [bacterium D16-50]
MEKEPEKSYEKKLYEKALKIKKSAFRHGIWKRSFWFYTFIFTQTLKYLKIVPILYQIRKIQHFCIFCIECYMRPFFLIHSSACKREFTKDTVKLHEKGADENRFLFLSVVRF